MKKSERDPYIPANSFEKKKEAYDKRQQAYYKTKELEYRDAMDGYEIDEEAEDMVGAPPHYRSHPSGIECIEVTRHMGFNLGNAIKYIWRADLKNDAIEDLRKAIWYLEDELNKREDNND
jgi:hypothetical protein